MSEISRIPFEKIKSVLEGILLTYGLSDVNADRVAHIFTENSCDGVASHGLNRFPTFIEAIQKGVVNVDRVAEKVNSFGAIEQWNGNNGIGPLNAEKAMQRAVELSRKFGLGCVGLRNNNHWMRGGTYGLQAADAGCIGICWTNTIALMPAWGGVETKIGNNPMIFSVPHGDNPVLLDMAMSQFSNGKLQVLQRRGQELPIYGGYNKDGELTKDPGEILDSKHALTIGYWKGSGLALALDLIATLLAGGDSSKEISEREVETGVSQVFIAIDIESKLGAAYVNDRVETIVQDLINSPSIDDAQPIHYPGQGMMAMRSENLKKGIPVEDELWQEILNLKD